MRKGRSKVQKILILHSPDKKVVQVAEGIKKGAETSGHRVDMIAASGASGRDISFHVYDLVIVGSEKKGLIKGRPPQVMGETFSRCKRTVGQESMAFLKPSLFGNTRALRELMNEMEKQGMVVRDFATLKSSEEGEEFGRGKI